MNTVLQSDADIALQTTASNLTPTPKSDSSPKIQEHPQKLFQTIKKAHPHKFRRTLATVAIDKGMPIEQLQKLLGHQRIDTTLQYAMVKQSNVKIAHRKYIG